MPARIHVLGIRHHGPGSARSVARALDEIRPTAVVIEGPPELDDIAHLAAGADMVPPVAALVYVADEPRRASFYPMASFSPEWVALRWALDAGAAVRFADLPAANSLALAEAAEPQVLEVLPIDEAADPEAEQPVEVLLPSVRRDPIATLAGVAGYDDPERWWEDAVEHRGAATSAVERFAGIVEAMAAAREDDDPDEETLRREAAMRRVIDQVAADGHEDVVVVCGAYHAPVLVPEGRPKVSADRARLVKLPKAKVLATWAPWTSGRLSFASGYGAGVGAPGWYQHLFSSPDQPITRWLVRVATELRRNALDVSPASVVEATRLATTLATLRARPLAGLAEVTEAAQVVMCGGSAVPLRLIHERLVVGDDLGQVPPDTPMVPLAKDLAAQQKRLRLKVSAEQATVAVDLRQPAQLARSVLFHRLALLGVHWAVPTATGRTTGTFKEAWQLEWRPELAVDLIEAGLHGTTVESAATAKAIAEAAASEDLAAITTLVERCLLADLGDALRPVLGALEAGTARQHDLRTLLLAVEPLARTCRYGNVRGIDTAAIEGVLDVVVARASVGLGAACAALDDDAAAAMRAAIDGADRGVWLLELTTLREPWSAALATLATQSGVHGSVSGRVNRLLLDRGELDADEAGRRLSRQLSPGVDPSHAAAWLDGFLSGDAVILLHDEALLGVVDRWVSEISEETFTDLLPLLRRTFSRFHKAERRHIGALLASGGANPGTTFGDVAAEDLDVARAAPAVAAMARLLGLADDGSGST